MTRQLHRKPAFNRLPDGRVADTRNSAIRHWSTEGERRSRGAWTAPVYVDETRRRRRKAQRQARRAGRVAS